MKIMACSHASWKPEQVKLVARTHILGLKIAADGDYGSTEIKGACSHGRKPDNLGDIFKAEVK